jgi:hypothetical protein
VEQVIPAGQRLAGVFTLKVCDVKSLK